MVCFRAPNCRMVAIPWGQQLQGQPPQLDGGVKVVLVWVAWGGWVIIAQVEEVTAGDKVVVATSEQTWRAGTVPATKMHLRLPKLWWV